MGFNLKEALKSNNSFETIVSDRYTVEVQKAEVDTASTGSKMVKLTLKITDGDFAGRLLWDNLVVTQNTLWKVLGILEAAGSSLVNSADAEPEDIAIALDKAKMSVYVEPNGTTEKGSQKYSLSKYVAIADTKSPLYA